MFVNLCKYIKKLFKFKTMNKKKIKKYKVSPNESLCLAVSCVDKPAIESDFIYLSEQKQENFVAVEKKERRMIYGCALRANFPIYRNNGKEEYYLEFDAEAIDKISKDFLKNGFQKNWTVGHQAEVENLSVCESWIKESPTIDKSICLGLDPSIPVGSWFIGCYCENDDVWNDVKEGHYHGFSCEALVSLEEFESQIKADEATETKTEIEENKLETAMMEEVDVKGSEATKVEHLEQETPTVEEPNEPTETPSEPSKVEEPITTPTEVKEEPTEAVNEPKSNPLEDLVKTLTEEIKALKESNDGLQKKVKELGKLPSANPVNTNKKPSAADTYAQWRSQMKEMLG